MGGIAAVRFAGSYAWKPTFQRFLRPSVVWSANHGITANTVTAAATALSVAAGLLLALFAETPRLFLLFPVVCLVRMAWNAMDGMLASEHGQRSTVGLYLNELGDVVSDAFVLLPFAFVPGVSGLGLAVVALLSAVSDFAGVLGAVAAGKRRYDGPFGKSDRAIVLGVAALWIGITGKLPPLAAILLPPGMASLLVLTIVFRVRGGILASKEVRDAAM